MRENPSFALTDEAEIRRLIEENPWATLVSAASTGLAASHYPVLLDGPGLSIVTHVGRPDERTHELGAHELLVIVQGPHGYVSSSWYDADTPAVPTWNFVVAHLSGVPQILPPDENLAVLERLVDRFESPLERPRRMRGAPADAAYAERIAAGTVGLRLTPTRVVAKRKMSQNRPPEVVRRILDRFESDGPHGDARLAREMRLAGGG